jgi:8-amino-7-oxononanoate synthase
MKALDILQARPELVELLGELATYMKKSLNSRNIKIIESPTPIIPIYTHDLPTTLVVSKQLFEAGVYVNPVLPPAAPANECLLRVSLMATHTRELIDEAVDIIEGVLKEAGLL